MNAALYARVSTGEQSPDMQLSELRAYCQRRGWTVALEIQETASGGDKDREGYARLLKACRAREVDAVVVYRLDRLARSMLELLKTLEEFRALEIEFISLHEQVDSSTPAGKLQFSMLAAFAEFEKEIIRERVKSGLAAAKARGAAIGRPKRVFDVKWAWELREGKVDGKPRSWGDLENSTGVSRSTVRRRVEAYAKTQQEGIGRAKGQNKAPKARKLL